MSSFNIAIVAEEFAEQTPAQQLLDRFLIGYPRDGEFYRPENGKLTAFVANNNASAELERRVKDFGLSSAPTLERALARADALLIVSKGSGAEPNDQLVQDTLERAKPACRCFVHGALSATLTGAQKIAALASAARLPLAAGTTLPVTWRLPEVDLEIGARLQEALIVVQGPTPAGELDALDGLLPIVERRRGGETGVRAVRFVQGADLWNAGQNKEWSWPLLASALSRSDTPQGNAVKDGRTEDLVGLGLVPRLARNARGWIISHEDGLRSTILVLDGVVADYNFAVRTRDRSVISAQIYRPPAPARHDYSRLADTIHDFFRTGRPPWPLARNILTAGLLETMRSMLSDSRSRAETPELKISYSPPRNGA